VTATAPQNSATSLTATAIGGYAGVYTRRDDDDAVDGHRWITAMGSISMPLRATLNRGFSVLNVLVQGGYRLHPVFT
jgi:hypothetical protein